MTVPLRPRAMLATHDVFNMPPYIGDQDLWTQDGVESRGNPTVRRRSVPDTPGDGGVRDRRSAEQVRS